MTNPDDRLAAYARLAVRVGLNLQPGQRLAVNALVEHAPLVRAVARESYASGASFVDPLYADPHVRRAHIEHADEAHLGWSPP
jgi:aminopeptidase